MKHYSELTHEELVQRIVNNVKRLNPHEMIMYKYNCLVDILEGTPINLALAKVHPFEKDILIYLEG